MRGWRSNSRPQTAAQTNDGGETVSGPDSRLIALDVDDCLMPANQPPAEPVRAALQQLNRPPLRVVLASGKPCLYLAGLARGMGLRDTILIGENGADIWLDAHMPPRRLCNEATREELTALTEVRNQVVARYGESVFFQPNAVGVTAFPNPGGPHPQEIATAIGPGSSDTVQQHVHVDSVDWSVRRFTKGSALRQVAQHLQVSRDRIAAVGDSANDLSMLAVASLALWVGCPAGLGDTPAQVVAGIEVALAQISAWTEASPPPSILPNPLEPGPRWG
jgi:trehalose-6-phosphatase